MSQVSIIIGREFNERVRKKSFIITTLLMPLLMIGLMFAPMLIMKYSRGDEKQIAVIDESGLVAPKLQSGEELVFQTTDLSTDAARKELTDKFGVLYIGSGILTNPNNLKVGDMIETSSLYDLSYQIVTDVNHNNNLYSYAFVDNAGYVRWNGQSASISSLNNNYTTIWTRY